MANQQHLELPSQRLQDDDIYNVSPQQTGVTPAAPPGYSKESNGHLDEKQSDLPQHRPSSQIGEMNDQDDTDAEENRPALPPRRPSSILSHPNGDRALAPVPYQRSKERVMAYMVPLPQPNGPDRVPQRYMLYLPPAPDLLKPPPDAEGNVKERKRDKAQRRWQQEVKKAKNYNGAVVSLSGIYAASVRGAVYVLALLQRSELTFLSRLPRGKYLREIAFVHPNDDIVDEQMRFDEVRAEFKRNRHAARRDFWIATALLPFATAVDIAIPVFGGFSEVDMVWMVVTGRAWFAAKGAVRRMVLAEGARGGEAREAGEVGEEARQPPMASAVHEGRTEDGAEQQEQSRGTLSRWSRRVRFREHLDEEQNGAGDAAEESNGKARKEDFEAKSKKASKHAPVEMSFQASPDMNALAQYVGAVCHARNPEMFPDVGPAPGEAGVLASIGWAPEQREVEDREDDVAWQIRKTTEDLRVAAAKAAKTWEKWCWKHAGEGEFPEKGKRADYDDDEEDERL